MYCTVPNAVPNTAEIKMVKDITMVPNKCDQKFKKQTKLFWLAA